MDNLLRENAVFSSSLPEASADLWVAALDENDPWFNFLNWQTQYELTRFLQQKNSDKSIPMLYFCGKFLPAKMLLLVKNQSTADWAKQVKEKWGNLGSVKTQIFLPTNINRTTFEKTWAPLKNQVTFIESPP